MAFGAVAALPRSRPGAVLAVALLAAPRVAGVEILAGDNVLFGLAPVLVTWRLAERGGLNRATWIAMGIALCCRQDNLLVLPAVLLLGTWSRPRGERKGRAVARGVLALGVGSLLAYGAMWALCRAAGWVEVGFLGWLFQMTELPGGRFNAQYPVGLSWLVHLQALAVGYFGAMLDGTARLAWGMALLLLPLLISALGRDRKRPVLLLVLLLPRVVFYGYADCQNSEWWLLYIALGGVMSVRALEERRALATGGILLALGAGFTLAHHFACTWELRDEGAHRGWRLFHEEARRLEPEGPPMRLALLDQRLRWLPHPRGEAPVIDSVSEPDPATSLQEVVASYPGHRFLVLVDQNLWRANPVTHRLGPAEVHRRLIAAGHAGPNSPKIGCFADWLWAARTYEVLAEIEGGAGAAGIGHARDDTGAWILLLIRPLEE